MNKLIALPLALIVLNGCLIVRQPRDPNGPQPAPAPAPAPAPSPVYVQPAPAPQPVIVEETPTNARSLMLTYKTDLGLVYDAAHKVVEDRRYVVTANKDRGSDNLWLVAQHERKEVRIDFHRKNHKTYTTVRMAVEWGSDYECLRMAKDLHNSIGKILGEQGQD